MEAIGIILSAGASRRMGTHKALLEVDGVPLLRCHVDGLRGHTAAIRVGLGAQADSLAAVLPGDVEVVLNPGWDSSGPRETLLRLSEGLPAAAVLIITPVDVPPAPPRVLAALLQVGAPAVPTHGGKRGHPVVVAAGPLRAALRHGTLRDALHDAREVPVDWSDTTRNLNTPRDWSEWRG